MFDAELEDDIDSIPDITGIPDGDDKPETILENNEMDGVGAKGIAAFETLLSGMKLVIGSFIDIGGMEVIVFVGLFAMETVAGLFMDIEGIEDIKLAGSMTLLCGMELII